MPINVTLYKALQKQYGAKEGKKVYFAMEKKGSKSFRKGLKTAKKKRHTVAHSKTLDKRRKRRR